MAKNARSTNRHSNSLKAATCRLCVPRRRRYVLPNTGVIPVPGNMGKVQPKLASATPANPLLESFRGQHQFPAA